MLRAWLRHAAVAGTARSAEWRRCHRHTQAQVSLARPPPPPTAAPCIRPMDAIDHQLGSVWRGGYTGKPRVTINGSVVQVRHAGIFQEIPVTARDISGVTMYLLTPWHVVSGISRLGKISGSHA